MEEKHNSPAKPTDPPPPSTADPPSSSRRRLKRKASTSNNNNNSNNNPTPKRQAREKHHQQQNQQQSPVLYGPIHNGPLTRARLQPNYVDSNVTASFWDAVVVENNSGGNSNNNNVGGVDLKIQEEELIKRKEAWDALEAKIESQFDEFKLKDVNTSHFVPVSCGWFSWTKVHPLEEKALSSFFNGKLENRTSEMYMEIRNAIVKRFHANPTTQIEEKDLLEISVGELDARKEVMEFLDYWGLINYHPFPETDVTSSVGDPEETGKVKSLVQKLYEFEVEQLSLPAAPRSNFAIPALPSRLPESMITDESVQPEGPSVEYHCNSCSADCSRKRYHCQKQADFDLCSECFNDGKFDSDMAPSDFIIMEPGDAAGANSGKWTDQETLLLLEALELFKENWNEIAEHVATKTKAQCILHFVQMPIEDTFRDCDDEDDTNDKEKTEKVETNADESDKKKEIAESNKENTDKKEVDQENAGKKEVDQENTDKKEVDQENTGKKEVDQENADKKEVDEKNDDSKDAKETEEPKAVDGAPSNNNQPESSPMEISEPADTNKLKDDRENGVNNIAVKALREAFDAVGSLSSLDEKLSFADAGNPVMAMAAFLTRLVEPNLVTASARTSLKSVSKGGTGLQLSARHSFVLEDPADEKKPDDTESKANDTEKKPDDMERKPDGAEKKTDDTERSMDIDVPEVVEEEVMKKKNDLVNDLKDKEGANVTRKEKDNVLASSEKKEEPVLAEVVATKKGKNAGSRRKGSSKKDRVPVTEKSVVTEETNKQAHQDDAPSNSKKESADSFNGAPPLVVSQSTEAPKDEEMTEKAEPSQSTLAEKTENSEDVAAKDTNTVDKRLLDSKDNSSMHKLTRAAVTAISAAAVKAKLLADQEEDHIRQLATALVEKQLYKLEAKLAFFTEMDGVVSRAREQLERSKQRLYQERAQIIAARLGMSSANSTRPMAQSLPNRPGAAFPNAGQRPPNPMNMTPQRPPLSRPMMGPTPPFSNPVGPSTLVGNSAQISTNQAMK
uniref:SWI/SNF complex subunit SWI3D n=1 Tax=Erigeron canadensis TaxID=72917 RepID=UPI001CB96A3C|nr:SWI/SNF complex subunit SWI3D [Erigeron canadensis]